MELLITGSTGFVGRNLLLKVVQDPRWSRIILPVRDPEKLQGQLQGEGLDVGGRLCICRVTGDLWEIPSNVRPDLVIHAAGLLFGSSKDAYFQTNVEGSIRLVTRLPRTTRVIVLSSLAAGGPTPISVVARGAQHQDTPVSFYGASKLTMERELRNRLGSRLLILRPPMVIGPRDTATVQLFQMVKGKVWIKPGFLPKHYSWIDVGDLSGAILKAADMEEWPEATKFYLESEETITDGQLLSTAAAAIGSSGFALPLPQSVIRLASLVINAVPEWLDALPSMGTDRVRELLHRRWVCDGSLFADKFGWKADSTLNQSLQETAGWLKQQGKI